MRDNGPVPPDGTADACVRTVDGPDPDALAALRRRIAVAVRRVCPPSIAAHAEDIVQTVLVRLTVARGSGEGKPEFSSIYLMKAAYGATVDELRRLGRRREDPLDDETVGNVAVAPDAGPEREAASAEIARGIQDCLCRLVRPRRLAVTLVLQGCTVPEAAGLLRWSPKRTENLVYRGMADLRRCLTTKGMRP